MKRNIDLNEISDGRLYSLNDMVKADCQDCEGCSACCHGMGNTIVLDPLDVYRLIVGTGMTMKQLLEYHLELNVVDGIILPNLKLDGKEEVCPFLSQEGRCTIHSFRPGICRLFPLGRIYEDGKVQYFLQVKECARENRGKVKVKKWLQEPDARSYEAFVLAWHNFLLEAEAAIEQKADDEYHRQLTSYLLQLFYLMPYQPETDFFQQFYQRLARAREDCSL